MTNSLKLSMVLEFNIYGLRQSQTQNLSSSREDAIYQQGNGVMVDLQEPDQWSEDACHTSTCVA